ELLYLDGVGDVERRRLHRGGGSRCGLGEGGLVAAGGDHPVAVGGHPVDDRPADAAASSRHYAQAGSGHGGKVVEPPVAAGRRRRRGLLPPGGCCPPHKRLCSRRRKRSAATSHRSAATAGGWTASSLPPSPTPGSFPACTRRRACRPWICASSARAWPVPTRKRRRRSPCRAWARTPSTSRPDRR